MTSDRKDVAVLFPAELKQLNRWIVRTSDKHPHSSYPAHDGRGPIDPHNPIYQADYDTALSALERTTRFSGLGFVFAYPDGLTGIDFDHCVNPETQEIRPDVREILARLDTYCEISPSGEGVHAFIKGWQFPIGPADQEGAKVGSAEIYSGKRYFTVTGVHVAGTPLTVSTRDVGWLYDRIVVKREFSTTAKPGLSVSVINNQACRVTVKGTRITSKYETLMCGTITRSKDTTGSADFAIEDDVQELEYESQSSADYALLRFVIEELQTDDIEAIKEKFLESPLGERSKATTGDYLDRSIKKLLSTPGIINNRNSGAIAEGQDDDGISIDRPKLLTEVGNARRLIESHGKNIRYCHDLDVWFMFDGKSWRTDRKSIRVQDLMKTVLIEMQVESSQVLRVIEATTDVLSKATKEFKPKRGISLKEEEIITLGKYRLFNEFFNWAKGSETNQKVRGSVEQAKSEPGIAIERSAFDANQMICPVENGVLEFDRAGDVIFRPHLREDFCTRTMPVKYEPDADCPQFKAFLRWMFPEEAARDYVLGYLSLCLTGIIVRKVLILYGEGANGKSTLVKTFYSLVGKERNQFGVPVAFSTFAVGRDETSGGTRADLLPINGARFVTASESNKQQVKLDMARLKELTGGDQTTARGLWAPEPVSFYSQAKIILQTNNLPQVSDDSDGAWERLTLILCGARVDEKDQDDKLADKLAQEGSGILNLLIEHLGRFFQHGLIEPASVTSDTEAFRGSENHIGRFVQERCDTGTASFTAVSSEIFGTYHMWCTREGEEPESQKAFVQYLQRRFKVTIKHGREGNRLCGLRLTPATPIPPDLILSVSRQDVNSCESCEGSL